MNKKSLKYSEAVGELNKILSDLQAENIDVDEVLAKVKRAMELIKFCRSKINETELKVTKIIKDFEQTEGKQN